MWKPRGLDGPSRRLLSSSASRRSADHVACVLVGPWVEMKPSSFMSDTLRTGARGPQSDKAWAADSTESSGVGGHCADHPQPSCNNMGNKQKRGNIAGIISYSTLAEIWVRLEMELKFYRQNRAAVCRNKPVLGQEWFIFFTGWTGA